MYGLLNRTSILFTKPLKSVINSPAHQETQINTCTEFYTVIRTQDLALMVYIYLHILDWYILTQNS